MSVIAKGVFGDVLQVRRLRDNVLYAMKVYSVPIYSCICSNIAIVANPLKESAVLIKFGTNDTNGCLSKFLKKF